MATTLETLVELQSTRRTIRETRHRLENVPEHMQELHAENERLEAQLSELRTRQETADSERRAAEAAAEDEQAKVDHYQEQVHKVTTQREYGALLSEIDTARTKKRELEDTALTCLETIETAKSELAELEPKYREVHEEYSAGIAEWEQEKPALRETLEKLEGRREVLEEQLPRPALQRFDRLYDRFDGEALAVVKNVQRSAGPVIYRCSACNYQVRPQVVVQIRSGEVVTCESCQRICTIEDDGA